MSTISSMSGRFVHQRALEGGDHLTDGFFLVERGQPQADAHVPAVLHGDQRVEVCELVAVEGILRKPAVDAHRQALHRIETPDGRVKDSFLRDARAHQGKRTVGAPKTD